MKKLIAAGLTILIIAVYLFLVFNLNVLYVIGHVLLLVFAVVIVGLVIGEIYESIYNKLNEDGE